LLPSLGIDAQDLRDQEVQTANGRVTAKIGRLPGLWLDRERLADVEAAFIDDGKLGGHALLGMNVLGRYRMTIDDERSELRLFDR
jgi:predicted aspartyl protease